MKMTTLGQAFGVLERGVLAAVSGGDGIYRYALQSAAPTRDCSEKLLDYIRPS
jgi:hypothetical protein